MKVASRWSLALRRGTMDVFKGRIRFRPLVLCARSAVVVIVIAAGLTDSAQVDAATYYVAPTGGSDSNNGLSTGAPFATISKGVGTAHAGDTIYLLEGTFGLS